MEMSDRREREGTRYAFATIGARTGRGGYVTCASSERVIGGLQVALVGDIVSYRDGSEAVVIDGSGSLGSDGDRCFALVGSRLSNGDRIVSTPWDDGESGLFVGADETAEGLFDPSYIPPSHRPGLRLALRGSTTARGGVLREPGGEWNVDGARVKVGVIGDRVQYADGTTARVVSGLAMRTDPELARFAYVGSVLDNGDTITDSPERKGAASPESFEVVTDARMREQGLDQSEVA
jgi:uncharacterized Zn-binding protein involved in type VI secretion